jgi:hypothetical protein
MALVIALLVVGWVAASVIGTQVYFRGEQVKPIHERNWNSDSFEAIAAYVTNDVVDYRRRVPGFQASDAYSSRQMFQ